MKRLLGMVAPVVFLASGLCAQVNEASLTVGRTFVSTQTVLNPPTLSFNPPLHFGNDVTIAFNYGRLLRTHGIFGIRAELPVAFIPRMNLQTAYNGIPRDYSALFVTPAVRVNFFSRDNFTPWASIGGGYGRFSYSDRLMFYDTSQGPGSSSTGILQFGGGLDSWVFENWGARLEFRDFYTGAPNLNGVSGVNITTNKTRQHNYYVGLGVLYHF